MPPLTLIPQYFCLEHSTIECEHFLHITTDSPGAKLRRRIIQQMYIALGLPCPVPTCGQSGQLNNACTHIRCVLCDTRYCYFCAQILSQTFCQNGCPLWLQSVEEFNLGPNPDDAMVLAKFHHVRATRLLRALRNEDSALFDDVFSNMDVAERTISCFQFDPDRPAQLVVTLDDVKRPPLKIKFWHQDTSTPVRNRFVVLSNYP